MEVLHQLARVFCDEHRIILWKCLFCVVVPVVFVNVPKLAIIEFAQMVWQAKVKPPAMIVFVCWDFPGCRRRWRWGCLRPRFLFWKALFGWRRWRQNLSCLSFRSSRLRRFGHAGLFFGRKPAAVLGRLVSDLA